MAFPNLLKRLFQNSGAGTKLNPEIMPDTIDSNLTVTGYVEANTVNISSDANLKENIIPIEEFHLLDTVHPYRYNFKGQDQEKVGLIAQEVEKACPQAVSLGDDGYLKLDYSAVIAALIGEVQILKKQVAELRKDVGV